jgi:hypothetical protein
MAMKFWVRENGSPPFHGPLTLGEVAAAVQAGRFGEGCELLEAEGQSFAALKRATGWRPVQDISLPDVPAPGADRAKPGRRYPALEALAGWYAFLAVVSGIAAAIGCLLGVRAAVRDTAAGVTAILVSLVAGAVSVVTLLAFAEGIKLAIDVATDLRDIRERLSKGGGDAGPVRSTPADGPGN